MPSHELLDISCFVVLPLEEMQPGVEPAPLTVPVDHRKPYIIVSVMVLVGLRFSPFSSLCCLSSVCCSSLSLSGGVTGWRFLACPPAGGVSFSEAFSTTPILHWIIDSCYLRTNSGCCSLSGYCWRCHQPGSVVCSLK